MSGHATTGECRQWLPVVKVAFVQLLTGYRAVDMNGSLGIASQHCTIHLAVHGACANDSNTFCLSSEVLRHLRKFLSLNRSNQFNSNTLSFSKNCTCGATITAEDWRKKAAAALPTEVGNDLFSTIPT